MPLSVFYRAHQQLIPAGSIGANKCLPLPLPLPPSHPTLVPLPPIRDPLSPLGGPLSGTECEDLIILQKQ